VNGGLFLARVFFGFFGEIYIVKIADRAADVLFAAFAAVPFGLACPVDLAFLAAVFSFT